MENLNVTTNNTLAQPAAIQLPRMLPLKDVVYYTGLSSTTIYDMLDKKSNRYDPTFPIQVKLSKGRVAWVESEIAEWLQARIAARYH
ncbi:helix-turn-helix transcriptional regulator [Psychrobacter ciconiae]|uniref:helix-turn-helix transcriptional regulator n=1 Tax=Psychrobacter ciconiae TaxID=1553449 RepID=UPI001919202E|nr:AlpA family phage regulatory protein [Psychrobacter ciconiae]